jgi:tRNA-Thr(GGU) m(6)t(6)A37 methyltransferase TsaA
MGYSVAPVGVVHSCYKDKFGVPRQPGLVTAAEARLELCPPYDRAEAFAGLEGFSHLWILFVFHLCLNQQARLTVRPPRLGGNRKVGVFASRATHRPNPVGLSVVELAGIERDAERVSLLLRGHDLVDGTPVLDIKPYVPYADAIPDARAAFAREAPAVRFEVEFTPQAEQQLRCLAERRPGLRPLIVSLLSFDPRPAYRSSREDDKEFAVRLHEFDIHWRLSGERSIQVFAINSLT